LSFFMTAGQVSWDIDAAALLDDLPEPHWLLGDCAYNADWFRDDCRPGHPALHPGSQTPARACQIR
jgi:hypothetical protein